MSVLPVQANLLPECTSSEVPDSSSLAVTSPFNYESLQFSLPLLYAREGCAQGRAR